MNCLERIFHQKTQLSPWENQELLPQGLQDRYAVRICFLKGHKLLLAFPKQRLAALPELQEDLSQFRQVEDIPVVLVLDACGKKLSRLLRQEKIPYIVPDKAIYFPFLDGDPDYEKFKELPAPFQLQPSAQMLLFYLLYQQENRISNSDAMKAIDVSGLTLSRAIEQLTATGCFEVEKVKAKRFIIKKFGNREIFMKIQPHLFCPVQSYILCSESNFPQQGIMAGIEALDKLLDASIPCMPCRAIGGKSDQQEELDGNAVLQFWRYDPRVLSKTETVDPLSLIMALKNSPSRIVQNALLELMDSILPVSEEESPEIASDVSQPE